MKPCATLKPTFVATQSLRQHTANGHSKIGTFVDFSSAAEVASICKDRKRFGGLFQCPCKGAGQGPIFLIYHPQYNPWKLGIIGTFNCHASSQIRFHDRLSAVCWDIVLPVFVVCLIYSILWWSWMKVKAPWNSTLGLRTSAACLWVDSTKPSVEKYGISRPAMLQCSVCIAVQNKYTYIIYKYAHKQQKRCWPYLMILAYWWKTTEEHYWRISGCLHLPFLQRSKLLKTLLATGQLVSCIYPFPWQHKRWLDQEKGRCNPMPLLSSLASRQTIASSKIYWRSNVRLVHSQNGGGVT